MRDYLKDFDAYTAVQKNAFDASNDFLGVRPQDPKDDPFIQEKAFVQNILDEEANRYDPLSYANKVKEYEGYRDKPYPDAGGFAVGYGEHLNPTTAETLRGEGYVDDYSNDPMYAGAYDDIMVDENRASQLLNDKLMQSSNEAQRLVSPERWANMPNDLKFVMTDLVYNFGMTNLMEEFPKFLEQMNAGEWGNAANELQYSDVDNKVLSNYYTAGGVAKDGTLRAKDHLEKLRANYGEIS